MKRLVETNRWRDQYFMDLSPYAKLMLSFLYDNCDDVGAIDVHYALFEVQLKMNRQQIKESISELQQMLLSDKKSKLFIKDYLKHQQKLPIRKGTTEGDWIISKLESNLQRFNNAPEILEILNNIEEEKKVEPIKKTTKVKKTSIEFIPPTLDEFVDYFIENGYSEDVGKRAWTGYHEANWHDSKGNPVKNWRQKCQNNWFKPEHKNGFNKGEKVSKTNTSMSVADELTRT